MFGHRLFPGKTNWCIRLYISRRPRESTMRTKAARERKNRTLAGRSPRANLTYLVGAGLAPWIVTRLPADPPSALSTSVRQTKDTYSIVVVQPSARLHEGGATKGWNMPALKQISFEYARQIAAVKGLQPSK